MISSIHCDVVREKRARCVVRRGGLCGLCGVVRLDEEVEVIQHTIHSDSI